MNHFDEQAIHDLEFDTLRAMLQSYCVQPHAKDRMKNLEPMRHFDDLIIALQQTKEFKTIRSEGIAFPAIDFEELTSEISMLAIRDSVLQEDGFHKLYQASILVNTMVKAFEGMQEVFPFLFSLFVDVTYREGLVKSIDKVFNSKWQVKDDASPDLARIRADITHVRRTISRNFAKIMKDYQGKGFLGDTGEAFLNDRKVLAVFSNHKRKIPGLVISSSKTGSLTYIEPEVNIQYNFELESLHDDERVEIRKILLQLTNSIRHELPLIKAYNKLLIELDFIQSKSRLALDLDASLPELVEEETVVDLKNAYHPILLLNNRKLNKVTFPQSLLMDKFNRMLVISGPNAGGKSITMKTIGLLQVMLQSGLLVPVAEGSRMSFFTAILTDIGDNQSIENQLSTYSYRLKRMKYFLDVAGKRSLVLLDEFGTGSDPDLGGALAEVFFEELYNRKCFGVITTHYGNIKLKAAQLKNAVNGCMLFNAETLEPTYRLSIGQPGSSFTFEVAQINGISKDLINTAKSKLSNQKVLMDELLGSLQVEKTRFEALSENARQAAVLASDTIIDFDKKKERLEERLAKQQETIERNNKYLNQGRRMAQFIEAYSLQTKNKEMLEDVKKYIAIEKTKLDEERKTKSLKKKVEKSRGEEQQKQRHQEAIKVGSLVRLQNTKQTGTVMTIESNQATVAIGVFKTKVDLSKLEWIK